MITIVSHGQPSHLRVILSLFFRVHHDGIHSNAMKRSQQKLVKLHYG